MGDFLELRDHIEKFRPELKGKALDVMVEHLYAELTERTPPLVTWTEFPWPLLDGDWCVFEKEVGRAELEEFALKDALEPAQWLEQHLDLTRSSLKGTPEELLAQVREGILEDNSLYHPVGCYLFRSTSSAQALIIIDHEDAQQDCPEYEEDDELLEEEGQSD